MTSLQDLLWETKGRLEYLYFICNAKRHKKIIINFYLASNMG